MQVVNNVESIVSAYKEQYGRQPSEGAIRFIAAITRTGEKLTALGQQHTEESYTRMGEGAFQQLVTGIDDPETACNIAEYYSLCYMAGCATEV